MMICLPDALVPGIHISHRLITAEMEKNTHYHNTYELIYVIQGTVGFTVNNRTYTVGPNHLLFISNLEKHELKVIHFPYERYCLLILPEYFDSVIHEPVLSSVFRQRPAYFRHCLEISPEMNSKLSAYCREILYEQHAENIYWEAAVKSIFRLFLISLYRNYPSFFPRSIAKDSTTTILKIQQHLEDHCADEINLQDIAKRYYIDMYYLSRLFKEVTGYTFKEYLILQRISKAKELLFYSSEDITQVATASGFNNTSHFIRIFKKYEGMTPYQFRKRIRTLPLNP